MLTLSTRYWAAAALVGLYHIPLGADAAASCYRLNGDEADDSYAPCNPDAEVSACCPSKKDNGDICLSSGLCYAQVDGFQGFMFSNGCTDRTGKSKDCPNICPDSNNNSNGGDGVESWNIFQCNATAVCCRAVGDNGNCCNNADMVVNNFTPGTLVLDSLTATGTVSSSTRSANSSDDSCPKDNTALVGGAVGGVLGAALLGSLGTIALLMKKRNNLVEPAAAEEVVTPLQWQQNVEKYTPPSQHTSPSQFTSPQPYAPTLQPYISTSPPQQSHELDEPPQRHEM